MNDIEDQYERPRVWCRDCGQPWEYHLPDCPVLNKGEEE